MSGGSLLKKGLPYDAEINYLRGTGSQWIKTDIVPEYGDSVFIKQRETSRNDHASFGLQFVLYCFCNVAADYWAYPYVQGGGTTSYLRTNDWCEISINNDGVFINGRKLTNQTSYDHYTPLNTIALFARQLNSENGGVQKQFYGDISYFLYKRNNNIICELIPVRVGQVGYMYDKVTKQLFGNQGTGNFILGNDI